MIRWAEFTAWSGRVPAFAGRLLLSSRWQWAHGEGFAMIDLVAPGSELRIAPIQGADPSRQAATEERGERYGTEDARAFGAALQACFDVGDLEPAGSPTYVYLDVEDGTALSADYWKAWCFEISRWIGVSMRTLSSGGRFPMLMQGLLPCILCSWPPESGRFVLAPAVKACLDAAADAGSVVTAPRCHGFWARAHDPAYRVPEPALDWSRFAAYEQPMPDGNPVPVPVRVWRYAEGADAARPIPHVDKLSLDATRPVAAGAADVAFDGMLRVLPWSAASAMPTEIGIAKGGDIRTEVGCLASKRITIRHRPEFFDGSGIPAGPALPTPLRSPARVIFRYYSAARDGPPRRKDLRRPELRQIVRAGASAAAIWQAPVAYGRPTYVHLTTAGNGRRDALNAFSYAADQIAQPPHTPVYFGVDTDVTLSGVSAEGDAPTFAQIVAYFEEIQLGYADYLKAQRDAQPPREPVPYRVGVYGASSVLSALYARGLATHFWQAFPPFWGDVDAEGDITNFATWPHANTWMVCQAQAGAAIRNSGVLDCKRTAVWWVGFTAGVTGGRFRITVGGPANATALLDFNVDDDDVVETALRAIPAAGAVRAQKWPRPGTANGFMLFFPTEPGPVGVDGSALIGTPADRVIAENLGFVDINVGWGDQGGWRPDGR